MNHGSEVEVERAFEEWLKDEGWMILPKANHVDVRAERGTEVLIAEVKGHTSSPGLDVDTAYGQLLRRMDREDPNIRYAIVVPASARKEAERVPAWVHERLRITVYLVDPDGAVRLLPDVKKNSP